MKAVRLLEYGGQLVFNDVQTPTIARDQILVKIRSTAVNHLDLVEASGTLRQILPIDLPWIPGHEFSGIVEQIGSDVATFAPGDAVFDTTSGMGAYAEYLAVKAAAIARKPSNLSFEEAASVPVASQTAWQGIFTHGHLEKGQTILIHGGAGGVGAMRCNWHRMLVPPSLRPQAATMRRTSTPSEPAGLSIIERRSSRRFCEKRSMWSSTWSVAIHRSGRSSS
jgi:NADPH:quinone reductase-like Zn-dependent oxidoreductase